MKICQYNSPDAVAAAGAEFLFNSAQHAISARNQFTLALSGGQTPWQMLRKLAERDLPWDYVRILQVDERVAPDQAKERNLSSLREAFCDHIPLPPENLLAMPVVTDDLDAAAEKYANQLANILGNQPVLDVVHLGLGSDGHTASLVPNDSVLERTDRDVDVTGVYCGNRRMTLTYPIINRARDILWLIIGQNKSSMLDRLIKADVSIPAGRVNPQRATIFTDVPTVFGQSGR